MSDPGPIELAGDRVTITHDADQTVITFDDKGTGRVCGGCGLCCKLVPVPAIELRKAAGVRCQHSRAGKGCAIYATRPLSCRSWACRWLADRETAGMPRPDRCHYVIDMQEDYVEACPVDGGATTRIGVIQVWVDPAFPEAHRAPELRAYMLRMAEQHRMATIIRYDSKRAFVIFPPPICDDRQWHEQQPAIVSRDENEARVLQIHEEQRSDR